LVGIAEIASAITGDQAISETDLAIQGVEPIPIVRTYINWKDLQRWTSTPFHSIFFALFFIFLGFSSFK
jgi:hypothetical protein